MTSTKPHRVCALVGVRDSKNTYLWWTAKFQPDEKAPILEYSTDFQELQKVRVYWGTLCMSCPSIVAFDVLLTVSL